MSMQASRCDQTRKPLEKAVGHLRQMQAMLSSVVVLFLPELSEWYRWCLIPARHVSAFEETIPRSGTTRHRDFACGKLFFLKRRSKKGKTSQECSHSSSSEIMAVVWHPSNFARPSAILISEFPLLRGFLPFQCSSVCVLRFLKFPCKSWMPYFIFSMCFIFVLHLGSSD